MYEKIVPQVLRKYGVDYVSLGAVQKGYRTESYPVHVKNGDTYNLLFFKSEPAILARIRRADQAAAAIGAFPVRVRQDSRLIKVKDGTYAGLYTYLPGTTIPWESFTKKHIKLIGKAMADMHHTWRECRPADDFHVRDELLPLIDRMETYFDRNDVQAAMVEKLGTESNVDFSSFRTLVKGVAHLPGQQLVHMDMVRGNVLFAPAQPNDVWQIEGIALSGVIDFEKTALGHPLFDIARTLAFLLVDSPKPAAKVQHYFLDSGYHKRGQQPLPDPRFLSPLVRLFLLHDFYKFLRHTPYESLELNRHYTRTRDMLKTYGMISAKT